MSLTVVTSPQAAVRAAKMDPNIYIVNGKNI